MKKSGKRMKRDMIQINNKILITINNKLYRGIR